MWHYHKQIHTPIPCGTTCGHGCNQLAQYRNTSGKYTCTKISQQCPAYKLKHSERTTIRWANDPKSVERKNQLSIRSKAYTTEQRKRQRIKQINTKHQKRLAVESTYDKRKYNRAILYHSRKNYKKYTDMINPNKLPLGLQDHHLDHKVSKHVGWILGIPVDIMSAPQNLGILYHVDNSSKCSKCSLHPIELLEACNVSQKLINHVKKNIYLVDHLIINNLYENTTKPPKTH